MLYCLIESCLIIISQINCILKILIIGNIKTTSYRGVVLEQVVIKPNSGQIRRFSTTNINLAPSIDDSPKSKWSESSSSGGAKTISTSKDTNEAVKEFNNNNSQAGEGWWRVEKVQEIMRPSETPEKLTELRKKLDEEAKAECAETVKKINDEWAVTDDKVIRSKIMIESGVARVSEQLNYTRLDKIEEAKYKERRSLESISEAYHGIMRRKFDRNFDGSDMDDSDMSSVASFGSDSDDNEWQKEAPGSSDNPSNGRSRRGGGGNSGGSSPPNVPSSPSGNSGGSEGDSGGSGGGEDGGGFFKVMIVIVAQALGFISEVISNLPLF